MKRLAREKLVEKDIKWKETYTDKTRFLKEQFEDVVGPGSYFRFEGAADDGSNYYCIIGPAKVHKPKAKFFAGVRKLPATYSAGGKYFDSMDRAANYAKETWGVPILKSLRPYTSASLYGISKKVNDWKKHRENEEEREEEKEEKEEKEASSKMVNAFNLFKHCLQKEAMGYSHLKSRDPYEWWDYEELVGGGDERWNAWLRSDRSLSDVLRDANQFRQKIFLNIRRTYPGVTDPSSVFKTYIGYHPSYGAYMCSIGPYFSLGGGHGQTHVVSEAIDKFGYFIIRKRKSSQEEIMDSVRKNIENYMSTYGVDIEPSDMQLIIKAPGGSYDPSKKRQKKQIREVVTNLDPNSQEAQDFFERAPIAGEGSQFGLNTRGLEKVIRSLSGPLYGNVIAEEAANRNISEQELVNSMMYNVDFLKNIYKKIRSKYKEKVESGEAAALGIDPPPRFVDLSLPGKSGSIIPSKIPTNKNMARQLGLRKEIVELLKAGVSDPEDIQIRLNQDPRRKSKPVPIEEVRDRLDNINGLMGDYNLENNEAGYQELSDQTVGQITELEGKHGFDDLKTTFEMAKLYFSGASVPMDPVTKSKLGLQVAPRMVFDPPENFQNVTGEDLQAARQGEVIEQEREEVEAPEEPQVVTPERVEQDVAQERLEEPVAPEEEEEEEEIQQTVPSHFQHLFSSTLKNLVKIAKDLDDDGKGNASEEVHKIIRKYQKGIE